MRRKEAGHYLRTPLTVVKATLDLVLRRWDDLADDERRDYVRRAADAADRAADAVGVVEDKILHNDNMTVVLEESEMTPRQDEDSEVQNFKIL